MARFALKIDENVRSSLYKICRLCGVDNPQKTPILDNAEPELCKKILNCVGIEVSKTDKMPQSICMLCYDKVNDFFEFREMCCSTNVQTRMLLGLPIGNLEFDVKVNKFEGETILGLENDNIEFGANILGKEPFRKGRRKKSRAASVRYSVSGKMGSELTSFNGIQIKKCKGRNLKCPSSSSHILSDRLGQEKIGFVEFDIKTNLLPNSKKGKQINVRKRKPSCNLELLADNPPYKRDKLRNLRNKRKSSTSQLKFPNAEVEASTQKNIVGKELCAICLMCFSSTKQLDKHLTEDHIPKVFTYNCIQCNEVLDKKKEIRDHNLWHKISKTPFECGRCSKLIYHCAVYTKHVQACTEFSTGKVVETRFCDLCQQAFETENLYNWHNCILNKGECPRCGATYPEAEILKHVVLCDYVVYEPHIKQEIFDESDHIEIQSHENIDILGDKIIKKESNSILEISSESVTVSNVGDISTSLMRTTDANIESNNPYLEPAHVKYEMTLNTDNLESTNNQLEYHLNVQCENSTIEDVNIKQESSQDCDDTSKTAKPMLKIKIKKEDGKLNSSFIDEYGVHLGTKKATSKKKRRRSKIYQKPEQLAVKIKEEISQRESKLDRNNEIAEESYSIETNVGDASNLELFNNIRVPIISSVVSGISIKHCLSPYEQLSSLDKVSENKNISIKEFRNKNMYSIRVKPEFSGCISPDKEVNDEYCESQKPMVTFAYDKEIECLANLFETNSAREQDAHHPLKRSTIKPELMINNNKNEMPKCMITSDSLLFKHQESDYLEKNSVYGNEENINQNMSEMSNSPQRSNVTESMLHICPQVIDSKSCDRILNENSHSEISNVHFSSSKIDVLEVEKTKTENITSKDYETTLKNDKKVKDIMQLESNFEQVNVISEPKQNAESYNSENILIEKLSACSETNTSNKYCTDEMSDKIVDALQNKISTETGRLELKDQNNHMGYSSQKATTEEETNFISLNITNDLNLTHKSTEEISREQIKFETSKVQLENLKIQENSLIEVVSCDKNHDAEKFKFNRLCENEEEELKNSIDEIVIGKTNSYGEKEEISKNGNNRKTQLVENNMDISSESTDNFTVAAYKLEKLELAEDNQNGNLIEKITKSGTNKTCSFSKIEHDLYFEQPKEQMENFVENEEFFVTKPQEINEKQILVDDYSQKFEERETELEKSLSQNKPDLYKIKVDKEVSTVQTMNLHCSSDTAFKKTALNEENEQIDEKTDQLTSPENQNVNRCLNKSIENIQNESSTNQLVNIKSQVEEMYENQLDDIIGASIICQSNKSEKPEDCLTNNLGTCSKSMPNSVQCTVDQCKSEAESKTVADLEKCNISEQDVFDKSFVQKLSSTQSISRQLDELSPQLDVNNLQQILGKNENNALFLDETVNKIEREFDRELYKSERKVECTSIKVKNETLSKMCEDNSIEVKKIPIIAKQNTEEFHCIDNAYLILPEINLNKNFEERTCLEKNNLVNEDFKTGEFLKRNEKMIPTGSAAKNLDTDDKKSEILICSDPMRNEN